MTMDPLAIATEISRTVLRAHAADVDARNRFPHESIDALRDAGLIGLMVPECQGGGSGSIRDVMRIAAALGEECLSTALIWAMHSQQVAILAAHAEADQVHLLEEIPRKGLLVASVTSEYGGGADIWTSRSPLVAEHGRLRLRRAAPIVSYGAEAGMYLVKMQAGEDRPPNDVVLVATTRADGEVRVEGDWRAMGMRGTRSVPMQFDTLVTPDRIIGDDFRALALDTMVPVGYVAWAAAWFGAARGVVRRFVDRLRSPGRRGTRDVHSDLLKSRLARLRLSLDLVESILEHVTRKLEDAGRRDPAAREARGSGDFILLNNLKIAGSELTFSVVNDLLQMVGMRDGYLQDDPLGVERVVRDLRSAALMYHNDHLLTANGTMMLLEDVPLVAGWSARRNGAGEEG